MATLVADYESSDSESDENNDKSIIWCHLYKHEAKALQSTQTNFLTSQDASSSSDSDTEVSSKKSCTTRADGLKSPELSQSNESQCQLPLPGMFAKSDPTNSLPSVSVFANPFEQAREDKLAVLEKHVKMKEQEKSNQSRDTVNKKICYKFQKGHCRFGETCKFSHAVNQCSDSMRGMPASTVITASGNFVGVMCGGGSYQDDGSGGGREEDEETARRKRKERAGLVNSLVPSKKAMRIYNKQRMQERPWSERL